MEKPLTLRELSLVCLLLATVAPLVSAASNAKSVDVTLTAKWEGTPLLLEAAEFLVS
jgi:hypothetical protein